MVLKVFTYGQYIKCIHTLRLNAVMQLAEESAKYNLNQPKKRYEKDKFIKVILQDKKEVTKLINQFVEPREKIEEKNLIRYTKNYTTKRYKTKEVDAIYKLKNQDMFFLIEHQSTIDYSVEYRMLNYCLDMIQEWGKNKKINKSTSYPIIVPIVIYTGKQKWKKTQTPREKQISNYVLERYQIKLEYNLIDINKIPKQTLLEKNTIFSYTMLLYKAKDDEEAMEISDSMIKNIKNKEKLEEMINDIGPLLREMLDEKRQQIVIEKVEKETRLLMI